LKSKKKKNPSALVAPPVSRITISPISFMLPHDNMSWIQVRKEEFNAKVIPFLSSQEDDQLVVFNTHLGKFVVVTFGGLTAIVATFSHDEAIRSGATSSSLPK
jgi:hypothetical protein